MPGLRRIGADAEDRAAAYLLSIGYTIVTRRFKSSRGEIDIVALDGAMIVIVEVKSVRSGSFVPEEQVTPQKAAHLIRAVDEYLHKTGAADSDLRYDIVAVTPNEIRHHIDAFRP